MSTKAERDYNFQVYHGVTVAHEIDAAIVYPWKDEELPMVAGWLKTQEPLFPVFEEAAKRTQLYSPKVRPNFQRPVSDGTPYVYIGGMVQALQASISRHVALGEVDEAFAKIATLSRIGELYAQQATHIERRRAFYTKISALHSCVVLAHSQMLSAEQLKQLRKIVQQMPELKTNPMTQDVLRIYVLDLASILAQSNEVDDFFGTEYRSWETN